MNVSVSQYAKGKGFIALIMGCMFAGKSTEARRRARIFRVAGWSCLVIKHSKDIRYGEGALITHDKDTIDACSTHDLVDFFSKMISETGVIPYDCIIIDEIQLYNIKNTVDAVCALRDRGIHVICAGLDLTSAGEWWPISRELFEKKDKVDYLYAFCMECYNADATYTWSLQNITGEVVIGGADLYKPVCGTCFRNLMRAARPDVVMTQIFETVENKE